MGEEVLDSVTRTVLPNTWSAVQKKKNKKTLKLINLKKGEKETAAKLRIKAEVGLLDAAADLISEFGYLYFVKIIDERNVRNNWQALLEY